MGEAGGIVGDAHELVSIGVVADIGDVWETGEGVEEDEEVEVEAGEVTWSLKTVYLSPAIENSCTLKETS